MLEAGLEGFNCSPLVTVEAYTLPSIELGFR